MPRVSTSLQTFSESVSGLQGLERYVEPVGCLVRSDNQATRRVEREPDERPCREHALGHPAST